MPNALPPTIWDRWQLEWGQRTYVMGILNITPDSFSGDGMLHSTSDLAQMQQHALARAHAFVADGASMLDVGGESTRPGFASLPLTEELERVIPVITRLRAQMPPQVIISIDTYKAEVARQALDAGANLINDIWALREDPAMASLAAERGVPVVLMANMRGAQRHDPISDAIRLLARSIDLALEAGVAWEHIIIDPGIGFGHGFEGDLTLLRRLGELRALARPLLLGTSRKSSIGKILGNLPPAERLEGTAATVALGIAQGADIVRVHDVREMVRVARMSDAVVRNHAATTEGAS